MTWIYTSLTSVTIDSPSLGPLPSLPIEVKTWPFVICVANAQNVKIIVTTKTLRILKRCNLITLFSPILITTTVISAIWVLIFIMYIYIYIYTIVYIFQLRWSFVTVSLCFTIVGQQFIVGRFRATWSSSNIKNLL